MIRKFLVITKHLHLSSKRFDDPTGNAKVPTVELLLPLDAFWELERMFERLDYLTATNEDQVQLNDCQLGIYKKVIAHVVHEKDRLFVYERILSLGQGL